MIRCKKSDKGTAGCIKPEGHLARCTIRENFSKLFEAEYGPDAAPASPAPTPAETPKRGLGDALRARKASEAGGAGSEAEKARSAHVSQAARDAAIAELCELATALGLVRIEDPAGNLFAWINPKGGRAAAIDLDNMDLHACVLEACGEVRKASSAALLDMLGVGGTPLPDGGTLLVVGRRMIVRTESGALREARIDLAPAPGPAGRETLSRAAKGIHE